MKNDKVSEIVIILCDDGITPLQTVSDGNFISFKYIDNNTIEITVRTIEFPKKQYEITYIQFKLEPQNKHVLKKVTEWTKDKQV